MSNRTDFISNIDWLTASLYLALVVIGWLMIYAVGYNDELTNSPFDLSTNAGKQALFIGISFVMILVCLLIDSNFWQTFGFLVFGLCILSLVAVLFFGVTIKGATSWFRLGGFSIQPSEFAKFGTAIALSTYLSRYNINMDNLRSVALAIGMIFLPMVLILFQPDAGSALVFFGFFIVLFRAGLNAMIYVLGITAATLLILGFVFNPWWIVIALLIIANTIFLFNFKRRWQWGLVLLSGTILSVFLTYLDNVLPAALIQVLLFLVSAYSAYQNRKPRLAVQLIGILFVGTLIAFSANYFFNNVLEPHQQDRLNVWLQPSKCDPKGALYNVLQSKMSIGSGGLQGKGFLQGTLTKLNYVPEQDTDFIFCTIGEEQGFIGVVGIVGLYLVLLLRIINIGERQRTAFSRYYAYSVASVLFVHVIVNIGMTMGLVPIIGIPLPFISSGGSSILGFSIMIGVLLKLDGVRMSRAKR